MKRCSTMLIIREIQIKTAMRYITSDQLEWPSSKNVNWNNHLRRTVQRFLKKLKLELPYDPATPLLGIYLQKKKSNSKRYLCSSVRCSTVYNSRDVTVTHRGMDKGDVVQCATGSFQLQEEWNNAICSNRDGPRDSHTKWSKSDREKANSIWYHFYVESKKMIQMNLLTKQKQTRFKNKLIATKGERGKDKFGVWD